MQEGDANRPGSGNPDVGGYETPSRIGNPAAVPALIAFHRDYGSYVSRAGAMSALRALDTEASYTYMAEVVTRYALGNTRMVDSTLELVIACRALGEWGDAERAVPPLMAGAQIHLEGGGMPQAAIEALGRYPVAQKFLAKLASQSAHMTPESGVHASAGEEDTSAGTDAGTAATSSPSREDQEQQSKPD